MCSDVQFLQAIISGRSCDVNPDTTCLSSKFGRKSTVFSKEGIHIEIVTSRYIQERFTVMLAVLLTIK